MQPKIPRAAEGVPVIPNPSLADYHAVGHTVEPLAVDPRLGDNRGYVMESDLKKLGTQDDSETEVQGSR